MKRRSSSHLFWHGHHILRFDGCGRAGCGPQVGFQTTSLVAVLGTASKLATLLMPEDKQA